jgi:PEP-CTERM motif-containing protein
MKKVSIVLVALAAMLILPGAAKADSITGGSINSFGIFGLDGSANIGSQTFFFDDSFLGNGISFGSFSGDFTNAGFTTSPVSCGSRCSETQYSANFFGTGSSAGETGTITFIVDNNTGNIISGTESVTGGNNVPEPGTLGMFAAGLLGVGLMVSRRTKAAQVAA